MALPDMWERRECDGTGKENSGKDGKKTKEVETNSTERTEDPRENGRTRYVMIYEDWKHRTENCR